MQHYADQGTWNLPVSSQYPRRTKKELPTRQPLLVLIQTGSLLKSISDFSRHLVCGFLVINEPVGQVLLETGCVLPSSAGPCRR